jgi:hypothetical protein
LAQVKLLKITSGVITQLNESNDSARVHSIGLGVDSNFADGYSLSIKDSAGTPTTLGAGVVIYSNSGIFKVKQGDGSILGGFSVGGDLSGTASSQTVAKINGNPVAAQTLGTSQDGYVLTWDNTDGYYKAQLTASSLSFITYKPGGVSFGTTFATWAEVQAVIATIRNPLTVLIDDSVAPGLAAIPVGSGTTNCKSLVTLKSYNKTLIYLLLNDFDGSTLLDLYAIDGISLDLQDGRNSGLTFSYTDNGDSSTFYILNGAGLTSAAESGYFSVPATKILNIIINNKLLNSADVLTEFNCTSIFTVSGTLNITSYGKFIWAGSVVTGHGIININYDTNIDFNANVFSIFPGTVNYNGISNPICSPYNTIIATGGADYVARPGQLIEVDCGGGNVNITFPSLAGVTPGSQIIVKTIAISSNLITINPTGTDAIDNSINDVIIPATYNISKIYVADPFYGSWIVVSDNSASTGGTSFTAGGDLSGSNTSQTVAKLQGKTLDASLASLGATQDGYKLTWSNTDGYWKATADAGGVSILSGDVSGSSSSNVVDKIKGKTLSTTLSTIGAAQDGYVLTWVNGSAEYQVKPSNAILINQASHGFTTGQAVYYTGSAWALAKANAAGTLGIGIIVYIDANNFYLYQTGTISGLSGLTAGQYYFVSDATSGLLTVTEPTDINSYSNPLLFALSTTSGLVLPFRPSGSNTTTPYSTQYDFLLASNPVINANYVVSYSGSLVINENWTSASLLIKNIDYTYVGSLCSQEVIKVYASDGTTIVAQLTAAYTYTGGILTSAIYTRNI